MPVTIQREVVVNPGQTAVVEVRVRALGSILGTVENQSTNSLLKGVRVALLGPGGSTVAEALTGDDGYFRFPGVAAGSYTIRMHTPRGYVSKDETERGVEVPGGSEVRVEFFVFRHGAIEGHVVSEAGDPIADAEVELVDSSGQVVRTGRTDPRGAYVFRDLPVDKYTVRVAVSDAFQGE